MKEVNLNAKERFYLARLILEAAIQDESFEPYVDWTLDSDTELEALEEI